MCLGTDRFTWDSKHGRGDYYCRQCGPGDGFKLIMESKGINFIDARELVMSLAGISEKSAYVPPSLPTQAPKPAIATERIRAILRQTCAVDDCDPARRYLQSRGLWPLPAMHKLRAHPSVEYWNEGERLGRFPALVASVRDVNGQVVTAHVTYLQPHGAKIDGHPPRKILSAMTERVGCACRLMNNEGETLGIAEGIETSFSAAIIHGIPVWATLNTSLMQKFEPPQGIKRLVIFADRDIPGLGATATLMQRLQGRVDFEFAMPQLKDWNEALMERI